MSSPIISVKNIGKKYKLGATLGGRNYKTLRDTIAQSAKRIVQSVRRAGHGAKGMAGNARLSSRENLPAALVAMRPAPCAMRSAEASPREFWALKDISFDVNQGEVVGIIGRNGAGKSTLLKILSEITEPTEGEIRIRGRVASLLEVGTGFHPELSGRENIFMNGAILGMTRAEILAKFDEIVAFAEVEKFIDTPIKRYSSGMQVRLAFAVAAHLEPEILLVDEVLAVGDIAFQKKCLGKMGDVTKEGRTVLFVSHNMGAVSKLCPRTIWLNSGSVVKDEKTAEVVSEYVTLGSLSSGFRIWNDISTAPGNDVVRLNAVRIMRPSDQITSEVAIDRPVIIEMTFCNYFDGATLHGSIHLYDKQGVCVLDSANLLEKEWHLRPFPVGKYKMTCEIPANFLNDGLYTVGVLVTKGLDEIVKVEDAISFTVYDNGTQFQDYHGRWLGVVRPILTWHTEFLGNIDQ